MNRRSVILIAAAVVIVDQAVKALVRANVAQGSVRELIPGIDLVHTENTGVSFGMLSGAPSWVVGLVSATALIVVVALLVRAAPGKAGQVAVGLVVGGAIGNLIDRVLLGSVTDFLDLPLLPPCNIADIAITFGALTMAVAIAFGGDRASDDETTPKAGSTAA